MGGAAALAIGLGVAAGERPRAMRPGALFEADFAHNRYVWNGRVFSNEAAFLTAIGGTKSGIARTIGPHVDPSAPELLSNGDFSGGTAGWSAYNDPLLSVPAGEMVVDGNSQNSVGFHQAVGCTVGKAYRYQGTYRRGTTVNGTPELRFSANPGDLSGAVASTPGNSTASPLSAASAGPAEAATMYAGVRVVGATIVGTSLFDDLSLKEALPFAGFVAGSLAAVIEGTTPASVAGDKALFQTDDGSSNLRNYVRVVFDGTGHLRLVVRFADAEVVNLDLGAVAVSTPFRVAFSPRRGRSPPRWTGPQHYRTAAARSPASAPFVSADPRPERPGTARSSRWQCWPVTGRRRRSKTWRRGRPAGSSRPGATASPTAPERAETARSILLSPVHCSRRTGRWQTWGSAGRRRRRSLPGWARSRSSAR